eukprot:CAMPEP_0202980162 /NCGR_PEP_ID=MMETSP1396-20130829/86132_1 /ASSEMBLY_ACC=CAM_ASM_000872 /TAXON_ID= /ORGANISM="Pseudokeronopsis sp., Strain Brazil" /LENGTH=43 /DNA_ID= /DNA_START= /DNA_END= /DNA_ORIENTATION=
MWMADVEVDIRNEKQTSRGGTGIGIYYVSQLEVQNDRSSIFGY